MKKNLLIAVETMILKNARINKMSS